MEYANGIHYNYSSHPKTTKIHVQLHCHNRFELLYLTGGEEILNRRSVQTFSGLDVLESQKLEWFVRAKEGTELTITAVHPKGGVAKAVVKV